jgi:hypothetical protein
MGITELLRLNPAQNEITAIPELIKALPLMESTAASKPDSISRPAISALIRVRAIKNGVVPNPLEIKAVSFAQAAG